MTYCGGILVREGLVMFADTRTNAGVDNISTFRKLHVFKDPKKRVMAIATAGNLSISQSVVSILIEGYDNPETGERETLMNAPTMFQAAQRVGHVIRTIHATEGKALEASDVNFDVSFLFGGQIMGERMRLFMIYSAGNFIECTTDTPYLQIGEHKYGKPVLDRAINYEMDLYDALKVGLVSINSTMRSNLSVGMPIDLLVVRRDTCDPELIYRIEPGEPYFTDLRERWSAALRAAHIGIPAAALRQQALTATPERDASPKRSKARLAPRALPRNLPAINERGRNRAPAPAKSFARINCKPFAMLCSLWFRTSQISKGWKRVPSAQSKIAGETERSRWDQAR